MKTIAYLLLAAAILTLVGLLTQQDRELSTRNQCINIIQWELDRADGIEPHNRRGWPTDNPELRQYCLTTGANQ